MSRRDNASASDVDAWVDIAYSPAVPIREYVVRVGERQHRVEVEVDRHGQVVRTTVDDAAQDVVELPQARSYLVRRAGHTEQLRVGLDAGLDHAWLRGAAVPIEVQTAVEAELEHAMGGRQDGDGTVVAPMPGQVVKVLVEVGAEVERDQPLLVVEAMKMENELRAPRAGRLEQVLVKEGQAIEAGHVLAKIAAEASSS